MKIENNNKTYPTLSKAPAKLWYILHESLNQTSTFALLKGILPN